MVELAILVAVTIAAMAVATAAAGAAGRAARVLEMIFAAGAVLVVLFVMAFVSAEVFMRYALNAPIPGHLEGSELLVPVIVFLAISYTQATHGHVGMDLLVEMMAPETRRWMTMATLGFSILVSAVLAWFSFKHALQLWEYDDVTMTPPYFKTWPAAAAIPLGYTLVALRMYLQVLHLYDPERFPSHAPADPTHHAPV